MTRFQKKMREIGETDTKDRIDDKRFVSEIGEKGTSIKEGEGLVRRRDGSGCGRRGGRSGKRRGGRERSGGEGRSKRRRGRKGWLNQAILNGGEIANMRYRRINKRDIDLDVKAESENPTKLYSPRFVKGLFVQLGGELTEEILYYRYCLVMVTIV